MKIIKCLCGCGETVPANNIKKGFLYVNDKHRIVREKREAYETHWKMLLYPTAKYQITAYCYAFNPEKMDCITCYENQVATYRGCYEEPIIKKKQI